jgi:hypothetical protein
MHVNIRLAYARQIALHLLQDSLKLPSILKRVFVDQLVGRTSCLGQCLAEDLILN